MISKSLLRHVRSRLNNRSIVSRCSSAKSASRCEPKDGKGKSLARGGKGNVGDAQKCGKTSEPILEARCKVAVVVGGSNGFGFAAADSLLCQGARKVVIVDDSQTKGLLAVAKLCDSHGKNRASFLLCDIRNSQEFEDVMKIAHSRHKQIHILFNDLDKQRPSTILEKGTTQGSWSRNSETAIKVGTKIMGKKNAGPGGVIVNCASILGFMGWPKTPIPVYCVRESPIEPTVGLSVQRKYNAKKTGVRLIALCPSNRTIESIGLAEVPEVNSCDKPICVPSSKWRVGGALRHVMAWAETGSVWVMEPSTSPRLIPQSIDLSAQRNGKVQPKVYDPQPQTVKHFPTQQKLLT